MQPGKLCFAEDLVTEFASALHNGAEHLIVGASSEEDLARIQFEEGATDRPCIDSKVVRHSQDWKCLSRDTDSTGNTHTY